jgi:hypothetical protein
MLMEIALDADLPQEPGVHHGNDGTVTKTSSPEMVEVFMTDNPMAKIIIVIDTHCLDNGFFVWTGENATKNFQSCSLLEVSLTRLTNFYHSRLRRSCMTAYQLRSSSTFQMHQGPQTIPTSL